MGTCLSESWSMENTPSMLSRSMLYYIQSMGRFYKDSEYCVNRKGYNTMLLAYTVAGQGELEYFGQRYTLNPGSVFLIDCANHHYYATHRESCYWEFVWIHFNGGESRNYVSHICSNEGPVHTLRDDSIIPPAIKKIHKLYKCSDIAVDIQCSCIITEILTELMLKSCYGSRDKHAYPDITEKVIRYIERHFSEPIIIDDMIQDIALSKYHFARIFKKSTGYSPHEYLTVTRLNYSKELLKSTDYAICEIALKAGFDSPSHFIKTFKQKEGVTPLSFRKYWK